MITRPRVFSVPHLSGPAGFGGMTQGCPSHCGCPGWTCQPHNGNCIDATYGCQTIFGVIALGGTAVASAVAPTVAPP
jgi:hypothetical protein